MFLASSAKPIDDSLKNLVAEIEAQSPNLSVLAARQFRYNLRQTLVEVTIKEPRQFNVLEEFIIRAGIELKPPPTVDELASVLGLDPVFVRSAAATLQTLQTLEAKSPITVTAEGRLFYEKGSVPQPLYPVQIYAITDPLGGKLTFQSEPLNDVIGNQPDLASVVSIDNKIKDISSLPLEEIQQNIQTSGLELHVPTEGKIVTSCKLLGSTKIIWKSISIFVNFDARQEKLSIQIRSGKRILESESNWIESLHSQEKISLQALCELSNKTINFERQVTLNQKNAEIEARVQNIRQQALKTAISNLKQNTSTVAGTVVQLADEQIYQVFLEVLNSAKHEIFIYSPWVNQTFVDDNFLRILQNLAHRGVGIIIGYGICQQQEDEERPIPPDVEEKLRDIKTPENLPAIQLLWLGNSHIKEVIVDREIYLCGFHNWLDYRGEYLPQGELVYKTTIPNQVQEAYELIANRFKNHADKLWENALQNNDFTLRIKALCLWGALGMSEIALNAIQQNNRLEILPVWLNMVCQKLRSKQVTADAENFQLTLKTALSLLNKTSPEDAYIESLRQGWRNAITLIATHNPQIAIKLVNDDIWPEFLRLAITQPPFDTPEKFLTEYAASQNTPKHLKDAKRKPSKAKK
ncbi:MAG: hypothetical protein ACHBN1_04875 [Heteroscytonema crispum UTEX LB 1556]